MILIRGLNFNTPDSHVIEYLNKHGRVSKNEVIYDTTIEGPLAGLKNGDRKYQVDFSNGINLGSYHLIDGARVIIFYSGQRKTCGRCYETSNICLGGGFARTCEEKGGVRIKLEENMKDHWKKTGFEPTHFKLEQEDSEPDVPLHENITFSPSFKNTHLIKKKKTSLLELL